MKIRKNQQKNKKKINLNKKQNLPKKFKITRK